MSMNPRHGSLCITIVAALFVVSRASGAVPKPKISTIIPNSADAGGQAFTLVVTGNNFDQSSRVRWNGSVRTTHILTTRQLEADILASDIATAGMVEVTVANQGDDQELEISNKVSFAVNNRAAIIGSITPASVSAGSADFTLTINGSGFLVGSSVRFRNSNRSTTFVSTSQLRVLMQASDVATPGTASITVMNPGAPASNALTLPISSLALTITTNSPLPQGIVGSSYSQTLAASGGVTPYSWSVSAGTLPAGLSLNASSGTMGGTPSAGGDTTFTVQVSDSASTSATKQFQLSTRSTATLLFSISGVSDIVEPAQQPSIEVTLSSAHPALISGQLALKFTSNADVASDDPSIQFSTGGRVINFSIPANSTRAIFSNGASNIAFQTGTVAGTIEASVLGVSSGTFLPPAIRTLTLSRRPPAITGLTIASRNASGFELAITGFSTPRSLTQATFRFTAAQGANLETSTVTLNLATPSTSWFQSPTAASVGGQFRLLMPFAVQGEVTAIQSVSVTVQNGEGTSSPVSVQF